MKKFIIASIIFMASFTSNAAPLTIDNCNTIGDMAYVVMYARQNGDSIDTVMKAVDVGFFHEIAKPSDKEAFTGIMKRVVHSAYGSYPLTNNRNQRELFSISFSDDWRSLCYERIEKN